MAAWNFNTKATLETSPVETEEKIDVFFFFFYLHIDISFLPWGVLGGGRAIPTFWARLCQSYYHQRLRANDLLATQNCWTITTSFIWGVLTFHSVLISNSVISQRHLSCHSNSATAPSPSVSFSVIRPAIVDYHLYTTAKPQPAFHQTLTCGWV